MEEQLTKTHNLPWIIMLLLAVSVVLTALIGANVSSFVLFCFPLWFRCSVQVLLGLHIILRPSLKITQFHNYRSISRSVRLNSHAA